MSTPAQRRGDALSRAFAWWEAARDHWRQLLDVSRLNELETQRMAAELGVSPQQFVQLATAPGGKAELLGRRLTGLKLTPEEVRAISPLLLRDLERTCARCAEKERCRADMELSALAPGWDSYCPNSGTLHTIS